MKSDSVPIPHVRFGPFEVDFETGEVRKHGLKLKLQEKPLRVLQALLEKPGKLVTREDLRNKLWPEDHYVDFDRNLTIAMNRLRTVLSDSADEPRYIETLPRRGYRFIYPFDGHDGDGLLADATTPGEVPSNSTTLERPAPTTPAVAQQVPAAQGRLRAGIWLAGTLAVAIVVGVVAWSRLSRRSPQETAFRIVPVTTSRGGKGQPSFSPDGKELAYMWRGEKNGTADIYVQLIGAGNPLRLTSGSAEDCSPVWSPDGKYIAFARQGGVYIVPALGGAERQLANAKTWWCDQLMPDRIVDWSPDGKVLALGDFVKPQDSRPSLVLVSAENGEKTTVVPKPAAFVACPAFSPDGSKIAYAAGTSWMSQEIYVVPVKGGVPWQLTSDQQLINGLAWTADGSQIVFSSAKGGSAALWTVPVSGGTPQPFAVGSRATQPAVARKGDRLAYVNQKLVVTVWRAAGPYSTAPTLPPSPLIVTSGSDMDVNIAPDGKKIAFQSDRTGEGEIWTSNSDGSGQLQLTSIGHGAGTPRWSPDGRMIAFDCVLEGHPDIFVINAEGGSPHRLTKEPFINAVPSWSRDGRWIYFASDRTGTFEIWKVPSSGGAAVQVTKGGGFYPRESPDGKDLYYMKDDESLCKMPTEGGPETRVVESGPCWYCWKVIAGGICFVDSRMQPYRLKFLDFKTNRVKDISGLDVGVQNPPLPEFGAFDVSPDGKWMLYGRRELAESDIMLLEGFH